MHCLSSCNIDEFIWGKSAVVIFVITKCGASPLQCFHQNNPNINVVCTSRVTPSHFISEHDNHYMGTLQLYTCSAYILIVKYESTGHLGELGIIHLAAVDHDFQEMTVHQTRKKSGVAWGTAELLQVSTCTHRSEI